MQKELNSHLFLREQNLNEEMINPPVETLLNKAMTASEEIHVLRRQVGRLQDQLTKLSSHLMEQNKNQQLKFERWVQSLNRIEQHHSSFASECNEKVALLTSRITERKGADYKIQDLIEQQNGLVKAYEERLQKLQKCLSEKDIQINAITAMVHESQADITMLKRSK